MNWEIMGALSELAGAIAVVASLLYLSRQLRMTRQVDQVATFSAVAEGFTNHVGLFFSADDDLAYRGLTDRDGLSDAERLKFDHLLSSVVSRGEVAHSAGKAGLMSDADVELLDWWLREKLFCYSGAREWLGGFDGWYPASYLDRLRAAAQAAEGKQ